MIRFFCFCLFFPVADIIPQQQPLVNNPPSSALVLPDSLTFCGEKIPTDIPDVRERLEEVMYGRLGSGDRMILLFKRTRRFFPAFDSLLNEMGLPSDLKYLSVAESSLKTEAYSHADAAGLWQFIPSTGRMWGLRVDKLIDERFHVEKSTRAAGKLLKQLRDAYGSWCLAAAAYNTGQANLNRVIHNQQERDYFDLFLNKETRYYIFQIVVLKEILENPEKYGIRLNEADYFPPYDAGLRKVTVRGPLQDIAQWAKRLDLSYKEIKLNNFWIMKYTLPAGNWDLLVPDRIPVDSLSNRSADTATVVEEEGSEPEFYTLSYRVQPNETLSGIAAKHNIETSELRSLNTIRGDLVLSGSTLKIILPQGHQLRHVVQNGENLTLIARRYNTSVERLKAWNRLATDVISPGLELIVYVGVL